MTRLRFRRLRPLAALLAITAAACGGGPGPGSAAAGAPAGVEGPRLVAVGTVQDGGLPHAACSCRQCEAARRDPARRRSVASLGLVLPSLGRVFLIDATPDLREQLYALRPYRGATQGRVDRAPLDGIFLTHAHMGHYLGLAHLGFEAVHTRDLPVYCTPSMAEFLTTNAPWEQLVRLGNVSLEELAPGASVAVGEGVTVQALKVPHRDEYADTVAYRIQGPRRSVLYVPDTDAWEAWDRPAAEVLSTVDVAVLDGTFYSLDELPGRSVTSIGHPLITHTMDLLQPAVDAGELRVLFTHLNHSNPALDPGSEARRTVEDRGFAVLAEGQELPL